ncbi:hypothetical protein J6590_089794 [Homalodisca vitripennis]|nr:hypothetical protein J6590_089794 [Homalodisca vitripennis]
MDSVNSSPGPIVTRLSCRDYRISRETALLLSTCLMARGRVNGEGRKEGDGEGEDE